MSLKFSNTTADAIIWEDAERVSMLLQHQADFRFARLIFIGIHVALRISDLLQLRWMDIIGKTEIHIIEKKTKKQRVITIHPNMADFLEKQYEELQPNLEHFLFANRDGKPLSIQYINKQLKKIFKNHGVKGKITSHSLRKTFGKKVYDNNPTDQGLLQLSMLLQHSNTAITRKYIGLNQTIIQNLYLSL